jgi:Fe2+ transport system protein B
LTNEELQNIIDKLEGQGLKSVGTFGVFDTTHGNEFSIQANKEGLQLFALELLKASKQAEQVLKEAEIKVIHIEENLEWINRNADIIITCIEPIEKRPEKKQVETEKLDLKEKVFKYGCFTTLGILLIAMIIGLWTLFKFIF